MRLYLDTSVFGGCFDEGFRQPSLAVIEMIGRGEGMAFVSDILWREIRRAPPHVQEVLDKIPDENVESVMSDSQTRRLREAYIAAGVVGGTSLMDAHHVAIALINEVDVILSWNFKHMVNPARVHRFHEVNRAWGLPLIESRSPYELGD